jgi:aminocarboxymuconate-semialdehyde decarboxylase
MFSGRSGPRSGLDFLGVDHLVFSTDAPLGPVRETIAIVNELGLSQVDLARILSGDARKLLKLQG